ncbi:MAG: L-fucose-proton symporter [Bacteroidota bacterium]|nr:MAG: L-fucose transporter [Bacteroidetes bacterium OLB12]GIL21622.1 MAG: L-fucose-proton symporter [Bacteroidota bacterium]HNR72992.1 L-fucose:H+ symporter permease [Cyclobacteriaceae bacterium]HNU41607.1 L-fucose:H+ symporter permease [Cyclobacteriaceae bacterium]
MPATPHHPPAHTDKNYLVPLLLVTSLFFLWGLANILNSALIAHFQPVFEIKRAQALLVETAFYFGYFTIAIPAGLFIEKHSYKKGILLGLLLYAVGALLFIPAANTLTFGFFLVALYIIASGLAFLETAANPYVTILGKPETSVTRLNFSQSFNGVALVVGPWIAGQFIFAGNEDLTTPEAKQQAAEAVILPYTLIAGVVLLVAFLFFLVKMPEPQKASKLKLDIGIFKNKHLSWAVVTQFFYVGAQAGIWGITLNYITELLPGVSNEVASKNFMIIGTSLFVIGRFAGTWLMTIVKDHILLTYYALAAALLCLVGVFAGGKLAVYAILGTNFFMSIMFPTIFALGVKDLGEQTKLGSSFIIMAIVGGAIIPPVMGLIADQTHNIRLAFILPLLCFLVVTYYGLAGHKVKSV